LDEIKLYIHTLRILIYNIASAGDRAMKVGGQNLKVGGPKFFIDFSPEKTYRS